MRITTITETTTCSDREGSSPKWGPPHPVTHKTPTPYIHHLKYTIGKLLYMECGVINASARRYSKTWKEVTCPMCIIKKGKKAEPKKPKERAVHKIRQYLKSGCETACGRLDPKNAFGEYAFPAVKDWKNVTCQCCLRYMRNGR